MCEFINRILSGRERKFTIMQTFPDCQFEGIDLREPLIDPETHEGIEFGTKKEAEVYLENNPVDSVVKAVEIVPLRK